MADVARLRAAFPAWLAAEVEAVARVLPEARHAMPGEFAVRVAGERVVVPERMYHPEVEAGAVRELGARERRVLACLYSRHHDGYVRQRHCERLLAETEPWAVPYVLRLVGEYVREIQVAVRDGLPVELPPVYGEFVTQNASFFRRLQAQVVSYWAEYERRDCPRFVEHPGAVVLERLRAAAEPYVLTPLERRSDPR